MSNNQLLPEPLNQLGELDQIHHRLSSGETLFVQNNATAGLYYLHTGAVNLHRTSAQGHSVIIHRARIGETFAEASLFSETYHCTATACCESHVIECRRPSIKQLLEPDNNFARSMMQRFAVQLQEGRRRVELLSTRSANERILMALFDGLLIEDIASCAETIGLAPETVYRSLAQLSKSGQVVKTARGQYQLAIADTLS